VLVDVRAISVNPTPASKASAASASSCSKAGP